MVKLERLLKIAEDELTKYSSNARKIEKLRRKIRFNSIGNKTAASERGITHYESTVRGINSIK